MIIQTVRTFGVALLLAAAPSVLAQTTPAQAVEEEAVKRQELTILLRRTLKDAEADQKKGDLAAAVRRYEECWSYVQRIGDAGIEAERQETVTGFSQVYLETARKSYARAQYSDAKIQTSRVLKVDPKNTEAQKLLAEVEKALKEQEGRLPSKDTLAMIPEVAKDKTTAGTMVQDGKLLYELGKLDEAEVKLRQATKLDPENQAAFYYLRLVAEARFTQDARKRELMAKEKLVEVENSWNPPVKWGNVTNTSNPFARTNTIYTGEGRRKIFDKLNRIKFTKFPVGEPIQGLPLGEVIKYLDEEVQQRDYEKQGINFMLAPDVDKQSAQPLGLPQVDALGQPVQAQVQQEQFDLATDVLITLNPPLKNVRLADVLDAIIKVSNKQIKYSVEDYAIIFTRKIPEADQLFTRTFRVNPNTFVQGLEGVVGEYFAGASAGGFGATGGQSFGGGGGGFGGGGGGFGGGGGGYGGGGGGYGGGGGGGAGYILPRVQAVFGGGGGYGGGGGGFGGGGGGYGGGGGGGGYGGGGGGGGLGGGGAAVPVGYNSSDGALLGVNRITDMSYMNQLVRAYFSAAGVDLGGTNTLGGAGGGGAFGAGAGAGFVSATGKSVFFNDRTGILLVRATLQDLDIIEAAIQTLNLTPDQVTIECKFVEVSQDDSKALAFDWFLGNTLMSGGAIGMSGGTYPSVAGAPSPANPQGVFPGVFGVPSQLPSSSTDQRITGGIRNQNQEGSTIPAVLSFTGILTDPQFKVVIRALEQRGGVDILSAPKVTTVSGRQAQVQVLELQQIVVALNVGAFGGGTTTTGGTVTTGGATQ